MRCRSSQSRTWPGRGSQVSSCRLRRHSTDELLATEAIHLQLSSKASNLQPDVFLPERILRRARCQSGTGQSARRVPSPGGGTARSATPRWPVPGVRDAIPVRRTAPGTADDPAAGCAPRYRGKPSPYSAMHGLDGGCSRTKEVAACVTSSEPTSHTVAGNRSTSARVRLAT